MSHPVVAQSVCVGLYVQLAGKVVGVMMDVVGVMRLEVVGVKMLPLLSGAQPLTSPTSITAKVDLAMSAFGPR